MPSEMDIKGIQSSSFFSEELLSPNERQIGFRKTQALHDLNGLKREGSVGRAGESAVASSALEKWMSAESKMKSYELAGAYVSGRQRANLGLEKHAVGAERAARHSMQRPVDYGPGTKGDEICSASAQHANGFFSSTFSDAFNQLKLSSNNDVRGRSFGASRYVEEDPCQSLEEMEAQTIGNLLPKDDELLSGVTDGFNYATRPITGDSEDFDLFSSGGGFDMGDDGLPPRPRDSGRSRRISDQLGESVGSASGDEPSRTLFVCNVDGRIEDSELQIIFEQFGDIQTLHTTFKLRGFVMVSYYDIRAAEKALRSLQYKQLRNQTLDIQYSIPKESSSEKDINQGTLVVYNLESSVSHEELRQIFGVYGEIKEIQEILHINHQKFIEFYDIRAAEAALRALDMSVIAGKQIKLEPSRPSGAKRLTRLSPPESQLRDASSTYQQMSHSPVNPPQVFPASHGGIPSFGMDSRTASGPQSIVQATVNPYAENVLQYGLSNSGSPSLMKIQSVTNQHSLPEYHNGLNNGSQCNCQSMALNKSTRSSERIESHPFHRAGSSDSVFSATAAGSLLSPGHNYMWSSPQTQGMMWPNSPTFVNGLCTAQSPSQLHTIPRTPSHHMMNTVIPLNSHQVGSAPSVNRSLWDRRRNYAAEAPDVSSIHGGSLGNMRNSGNSPQRLEFLSQNLYPHVGGNCIDLAMPAKNAGLHSPHHGCLMFPGNPMIPMMTPLGSPNERGRSQRNDGGSNQADKKQFDLDLDRIMRGEDKRTTLMIKNIPNKYTSKMLLGAIDERHRGSYDFIYLPIDFKNKCNVGYAFINMVDPSVIIPFYQSFNGKRWEKFNSEKVASLAYARIQGKAALIAHFQNSSLMNEDKRCRPILFNTDGPNAGDPVPFPMGVNVRPRQSKTRAMSREEIHQETKPDVVLIEEKSSFGDTSSSSSKDSD